MFSYQESGGKEMTTFSELWREKKEYDARCDAQKDKKDGKDGELPTLLYQAGKTVIREGGDGRKN